MERKGRSRAGKVEEVWRNGNQSETVTVFLFCKNCTGAKLGMANVEAVLNEKGK